MKTLILFSISLSSVLYAQTKSEALELYRLRGENSENAIKAARIFETLAKTETQETEKCFLLNKSSYLNFFHGTQQTQETSLISISKTLQLLSTSMKKVLLMNN